MRNEQFFFFFASHARKFMRRLGTALAPICHSPSHTRVFVAIPGSKVALTHTRPPKLSHPGQSSPPRVICHVTIAWECLRAPRPSPHPSSRAALAASNGGTPGGGGMLQSAVAAPTPPVGSGREGVALRKPSTIKWFGAVSYVQVYDSIEMRCSKMFLLFVGGDVKWLELHNTVVRKIQFLHGQIIPLEAVRNFSGWF